MSAEHSATTLPLVNRRIPVFLQPGGVERLENNTFIVESMRGSEDVWRRAGQEILQIHRQIFTPLIQRSDEVLHIYEVFLKEKLTDPTSMAVLLYDKQSQALVGFSCLYPASIPDDELFIGLSSVRKNEFQTFQQRDGITFAQYQDMDRKTVEVGETAILPQFRNRGGWSLMMNSIDTHVEELHAKHAYDWMVRVVRTEEEYADHVRGRYANKRLLYESSYTRDVGPQKYYRFAL